MQELVATLDTGSEYEEARYAELHVAVDRGVAGLDAGRGIELTVDELDGYLRERSRLATERAIAKNV